MINLYRPKENRLQNKSLTPYNKSHTASMNLKITADPSESTHRNSHKQSYRNDSDNKSRSAHKYKKSILLQDTTINLTKKNSDHSRVKKDIGMSTERLSREKSHKRSVDNEALRIKTEIDESKSKFDSALVEVSSEELKEMVGKLQKLRREK